MKILLAEDDQETADYVAKALNDEGHMVTCIAGGAEALDMSLAEPWDMLIVDRMLPELDGLTLIKEFRKRDTATPILVLTTMSGVHDRVEGLNAGGDDYLAKPFAMVELSARVQALGRRPLRIGPETVLRLADLEMDLISRTVKRRGALIVLQHREFQLLEYFLRNANSLVTRTMLLEQVFGFSFVPRTNFIESHISRLRNKINRPDGPELIHTIRGSGYIASISI